MRAVTIVLYFKEHLMRTFKLVHSCSQMSSECMLKLKMKKKIPNTVCILKLALLTAKQSGTELTDPRNNDMTTEKSPE